MSVVARRRGNKGILAFRIKWYGLVFTRGASANLAAPAVVWLALWAHIHQISSSRTSRHCQGQATRPSGLCIWSFKSRQHTGGNDFGGAATRVEVLQILAGIHEATRSPSRAVVILTVPGCEGIRMLRVVPSGGFMVGWR